MSTLSNRGDLPRLLGLAFVFAWFFLGGIAHFVLTDLEMSIVPSWLPEHRWLVLISGFFELAGALGLLLKRTRGLAGLGLILLTLAVTPANIYMWQNPELFPTIPYWVLTIRLPAQLALLACIWWSTRESSNSG
jgi:uncharacterized membrane protein